jgi:apolipoprotein N-acyltransferase
VHQRTGVSEQKVISGHVAIRSGKTIYVALGDKPWVALIALVFLLAILNRSKYRFKSRT